MELKNEVKNELKNEVINEIKNKKNKKKGCLIKAVIIILIIIFILITSTFIYYLLTRESPEKYIPNDFTGYVKIDSISRLYDNLIELRAADVVLAQEKLKNFYKIFLDFKSSKLSKNKLISSIMNMKANVILKKDYSPVLIFDLGYKSLLFRATNLTSDFIIKFAGNQGNFTIEKIKENKKYSIYKLIIKTNKIELYFSINKNLLFLSQKKEDIDFVYGVKENGNNIYNDNNFYLIKNQIKSGSLADFYFNTNDVINPITSQDSGISKIINKLDFYSNSAVSMYISNANVSMNTFTSCSSKDEKIKKILESNISNIEAVKYLPVDINICSILSMESFEDLYKLFLYLQKGQYDSTINTINNACTTLFQMNIKDLLFSWTGKEIGLYTTNNYSEPVIFIKIRDKKKLENVIDKIVNSLVLSEDRDLKYDEVLLKKIKFPDFIQWIISVFLKMYLDAPYYTIIEDYIFFSMEPAALSNLVKKYQKGTTLENDKVYKEISGKVEKKSNVFLYFNLSESTPKFLYGNGMILELLKLYEKGAMTINLNNSSLKIDLNASGINIKKVKDYSGYPKKLNTSLISQLICKNVIGSQLDELIYVTSDQKLIVTDINNSQIGEFPINIEGNYKFGPYVFDLDEDGTNEIYIFTDNGKIHKYNSKGKEISGYPIEADFKDSFEPVVLKDKFLFYSKQKKKLILFNEKISSEINFDIKNPILTSPNIYQDSFAIYPKSAEGTIYLINPISGLLNGWPKKANGVGYGTPVINESNIIFLTQSGELHVWKWDGNESSNYPIKLDGVYYNQPEVQDILAGGEKEIVTLNKDGIVSIISKGKIIQQKSIKDADSKERKLILFDVNMDGKKEIFIYEGKNNIIALDGNLRLIQGFPVKGYSKPEFSDFNSDGEYEMVTVGSDNYIYVYTIPK